MRYVCGVLYILLYILGFCLVKICVFICLILGIIGIIIKYIGMKKYKIKKLINKEN